MSGTAGWPELQAVATQGLRRFVPTTAAAYVAVVVVVVAIVVTLLVFRPLVAAKI